MSLESSSATIPTGPVIGQTYDFAGKTYEYIGNSLWKQQVPAEEEFYAPEQWISLTAAYTTLASTTSFQNIFPNSLIVRPNSVYTFMLGVTLSSISATSGTCSFQLGGAATITRYKYLVTGDKVALATGQAFGIWNTTGGVFSAANTNTTARAFIIGVARIGAAGGTLDPQMSCSIASQPIVGQDSYFMLRRLGGDTQQSTED